MSNMRRIVRIGDMLAVLFNNHIYCVEESTSLFSPGNVVRVYQYDNVKITIQSFDNSLFKETNWRHYGRKNAECLTAV
jgi:hypothetical protein